MIPPGSGFVFTAASIQDYVNCPRRFELRHLRQLPWPAVEAEPLAAYEAELVASAAFHRLAQQHQLGLPPERLTALASGPAQGMLAAWWRNYLASPPANLPPERHAAVVLSAPVGAHRLLASYDLIAVAPGAAGRAVIVDWRTARRRVPGAELAARLATRVARYVLVRAGAALNGGRAWQPEQVEMCYWFANFPEQPERLPYSAEEFADDTALLSGMIAQAAHAQEFLRTTHIEPCRFCSYRSLCRFGVEAGRLDELADAEDAAAAAPIFDPDADVAYPLEFP
jgi:hypothetical protein